MIEVEGFRIRNIKMINLSRFTASDYIISVISFGKQSYCRAWRNWAFKGNR